MNEVGRNEQKRAMRLGLACTRSTPLDGDDNDVLARVEVEHRLVVEATHNFSQAVAGGRPAGFAREQIAERVPGFAPAQSARAAEKLFELVSAGGSRLSERYVSWRCGDFEGLVLDQSPYSANPVDSEPGHRESCGRLTRELDADLVGLGVGDHGGAGFAPAVTDDVGGWTPRLGPTEPEGPALGIWMRKPDNPEKELHSTRKASSNSVLAR